MIFLYADVSDGLVALVAWRALQAAPLRLVRKADQLLPLLVEGATRTHGLGAIAARLDGAAASLDEHRWIFAAADPARVADRVRLRALLARCPPASLCAVRAYQLLRGDEPARPQWDAALAEAALALRPPPSPAPAPAPVPATVKSGAGRAPRTRAVADAAWAAELAAARLERVSRQVSAPSDPARRHILVTAALPYVNNEPHLGNLIGCVLSADCFARYARLCGHNTLFVCGTDEHGTATEVRALQEGCSPAEICDRFFALHRDIYAHFDVDFDHFGRTSRPGHHTIVRELFARLESNGLISESDVQQLHCAACDRFLADRFVRGRCPHCDSPAAQGDQCDACQRVYEATELREPRCALCARPATPRPSRHLFFDLPALAPRLLPLLESAAAEGRWPPNALGITRAWLRDGLQPRCITRDLQWGVAVPRPGFERKRFYVWFDAPVGYPSITAEALPADWRAWWHAAGRVECVQFMAKDNVPFHTLLFPAMLLGSGEPWTLVHRLGVTEYLTCEGAKFSKRAGAGVFGSDAARSGIPADCWRFYLFWRRPETADADFRWRDLQAVVNDVLVANTSNFVHRVLAYLYARGAAVPAVAADLLDEHDRALLAAAWGRLGEYRRCLDALRLREALRALTALTDAGNAFVQRVVDSRAAAALARNKMALAANVVRLTAALLEPFTPALAQRIYLTLGVRRDARAETLLAAVEAEGEEALATLLPAGPLRQPLPLVQPLTDELITQLADKYAPKTTTT